MRSISGFNSSYLGGSFGAGEYVTASALNKMGVGLDMNRTMMSQGIEFMNSAGGVAFNTPQEVIDISNSAPPFFVYLVKEEDADAVRVITGTVNNVIPYINGVLMTDPTYPPILLPTGDGLYQIVVKCKADPSPASFPKLDSEIKVETYPTTNTDDYGFIALANIIITTVDGKKQITVNQLVGGSQWGDRLKCGSNTAEYFFSMV